MHNNSTQSKNKVGTVLIWLFVILLFGSFITLATTAIARARFQKSYIITVGDALGSGADVYSAHNDEYLLLSHDNVAGISRIAVSGSIMWGRRSDKLTGNMLILTAKIDDGEIGNHVYIEEMRNGKSRVTVETADKTATAVLNDVSYSSFLRMTKEHAPMGDNTPVESIP